MLANLSWRELLIVVCVLLAIYAAFVFFRINNLKREKPLLNLFDASPPHPAAAAYAAVEAASPAPPELPAAPEPAVEQRRRSAQKYEQQEPVLRDAQTEAPSQKTEKKVLALEREIDQLRKEVGSLRAEILLLREACRETAERVEEEVVEEKTAIPPISPFYNDAMQMAAQGESIESISQFCGISRAEAELVVALVRNRDNGV
ncbi:MAG: DUF2802 domain-containing protein [Candidatus Accumulibacter sp.]|nr:DUF2802 domain-containing protein [Accumulibacter sp.]